MALEGGEHAEAMQGLAECLYFLGRRKDAIRWASKALSLEPKSARAHLILSRSYVDNLDFAKGNLEIQKALVISPNMIDALFFMSYIQIAQNKTSEALETLSKISNLDENNSVAHYYIGLIRQKEKSYREATIEFLRAFHLTPSLRPLLRLLEIYTIRYLVWIILILFIILFVSVKFLRLFWMPLLYLGFSILLCLVRFFADRDRRYLLFMFIVSILGLIYYFGVFK